MLPLPVRAVSSDPANLGTADCSLICHCDDGSDYAVKDVTTAKFVRHSEWFCKHLGDQVGIASPDCRIVQVAGDTAFGSRWESGHKPDNWVFRVEAGEIFKQRIAPTLSRIFAFDLFVHNIDRHATNYIVRPQANDQISFLAFDYSRAWLAAKWPLPTPPMNANIVTRRLFKKINSKLNGILEKDEAYFVIDRLEALNTANIEAIINSHPASWLDQNSKNQILEFWEDGSAKTRLDKIRKGFKNDEYI